MSHKLTYRMILSTLVVLAASIASPHRNASAATISAADLTYGISTKNGNSFNFDFTAQPVWTAGEQRSDNGNADSTNQRAGRVFAQLQLTQAIIDAANAPNNGVTMKFTVDSIGQGVVGTPYTDGLDLRYLGISASNRTVSTLWNTGGVGGPDQADILATNGSPGSHTILLTNASILSNIAAATAGQFIAFGFSNSLGVNNADPVGNSTAETYGFQMNQDLSNTMLTINVIPEPSTLILAALGVIGFAGYRRRRQRV